MPLPKQIKITLHCGTACLLHTHTQHSELTTQHNSIFCKQLKWQHAKLWAAHCDLNTGILSLHLQFYGLKLWQGEKIANNASLFIKESMVKICLKGQACG